MLITNIFTSNMNSTTYLEHHRHPFSGRSSTPPLFSPCLSDSAERASASRRLGYLDDTILVAKFSGVRK